MEPRTTVGFAARFLGGFEATEIDIAAALHRTLYPERCIVDIGANIGIHSLAWSRLAPVVAVEPAPRTFDLLQGNVAVNELQERIRTVRSAVGETSGEVEFFIAKDSAFSSMKDTERKRIVDRVRVPCTTLDELSVPSNVGLVKIDVEGFERAVIAGGGELLRRDRPVLFVEIYGGKASNPDPEGTVREICDYGYEAFVYGRTSGLLPFEKHRDDRYNYFFVPR